MFKGTDKAFSRSSGNSILQKTDVPGNYLFILLQTLTIRYP
jgi:hypothetical protein